MQGQNAASMQIQMNRVATCQMTIAYFAATLTPDAGQLSYSNLESTIQYDTNFTEIKDYIPFVSFKENFISMPVADPLARASRYMNMQAGSWNWKFPCPPLVFIVS